MFGLYMGEIEIDVDSLQNLGIDKSINWPLVSHLNKTIQREAPLAYQPLGVLALTNVEEYIEGETKGERIYTFEISNLGTVRFDDDDTDKNQQMDEKKIEIENMYFSQPLGSKGGCFGCNVLGTSKGGVNFGLTSTKALNEKTIELYANNFKYWIDQALELEQQIAKEDAIGFD
ncbi:unnamed protein product [Ambrosiozyma monospora]|uniref:Unnamed protein product n=1 Tax=Ambrosiozyma monospora TaxID=43982 RepID=A0A9W7DJ08_AMBMO|nr:unnamed protein product [Ambrosiozyma monospora]